MEITVNGSTWTGDYATANDVLVRDDIDPATVVVELNGKILPAAEYKTRKLAEGDALEIVQFVAGG